MNSYKNLIIAIDIGTQSVKVVAYDQEGRSFLEIAKPSKAVFSEWNGYQFDPNEYFRITIECLKELINSPLIISKKIVALCFSGVGGGVVCVNKDFEPISFFLNPLDGRDKKIATELLNSYGQDIWKIAGSPSMQSASKIKWFQKFEPQITKKTNKYLLITHYIQSLLCEHTTNDAFEGWTTIASQGQGDTKNYKWSEKLCDLFNIKMQKLPRILSPFDIAGYISKKWSQIIGLPSGIPIVVGAFDKMSSLIASGCLNNYFIFEETASWPSIVYPTRKFKPDSDNLIIQLLPTPIKNVWGGLAAIKGGGITHEWFIRNFIQESSSKVFSELDNLSKDISPGSENLFLIPHLAGQECPIDLTMKGLWVVFSCKHKKEHF